jgi:signal transduction histidine kinase/ligand-binding sensor domain-containing protein/DNA-binding response OmpR family regulator
MKGEYRINSLTSELPSVFRLKIIGPVFVLMMTLSGFLITENAAGAVKGNSLSFDYYSQENGLPNNQIQCIFQDKKGWMWFGTTTGLSRFDGYRFANYLNKTDDTTSLSGNLVRVIYEDKKGRLLIGTENGGLSEFNRDQECFSHPYKNHPFFADRAISVNAITEDDSGNLWIGTDLSLLKIDKSNTLIKISPVFATDKTYYPENFIRVIAFDKKGRLWLGTNNGLFFFKPETNEIQAFDLPIKSSSQNREIWEIYIDDDGSIWTGTYSNGIFIIDPESLNARKIILDPYAERTETVRAISKGIFGNYWIGTRGGLYIYSKDKGVTGFYKHDAREIRSLSNNSVLDIFNDSKGETWIGTRGGINLLAKSKQVFRNFTALPNDNHYLNSSIIYAFWVDDAGKIWVGTEDGGVNIYNPETSTYEYLVASGNKTGSISQNCIKAFLDDRRGNLWIGTFLGGIDVLNLKTRNIIHHRNAPSNLNSLSDDRVWALGLDRFQNIWIGTTKGVDKYDYTTGKFTHFAQIAGNQQVSWISNDSEGDLWFGTPNEIIIYNPSNGKIIRHSEHSRSFIEDSDHRYWIATLDKGIALYLKDSGAKRYFSENDGLANNLAFTILEDNNRKLWISTSNGLSKFDPDNSKFQNFTISDGLQNNQFSYSAGYKMKTGELLFGGISGFNLFNPVNILPVESDVPLVLTDLRIFNKPVPIGNNKKSILRKSISETSELVLNYDQNVITIEFAALNYVSSSKNLYSYLLEGFDKDWNGPGTSRIATYTNLFPDQYVLRIKRVIPESNSPVPELKLNILIRPPYWKTWWFRGLILLTISGLIFILIRFFINREKLKNELVFERLKAKKLHELDMLKLRFFTNISHEIRTPLTLILGPLEKIISKQLPADEIPAHLNLIQRNARHLDNLINQILDFRKLESGNLKLELTQSDLVSFIDDIVASFDDLAKEKEINFKFNTLKKKLVAVFDPDKVGKILNNLLSNAFKFTPSGGSVTVNLSLIFDSEDNDQPGEISEKQYIEISVRDSGQGIEQSDIDKIFTRFFQAGKETGKSGTGIGLALVRELVKLHNGKIFVTSKPGKGSKFTVRIPFETGQQEKAGEIAEPEVPVFEPLTGSEPEIVIKEPVGNSKIILIVEDNADVRYFIKSHFSSLYQVLEAKNGNEGWRVALEVVPDVIISDILMPDLDGYEFCKRIKKDERTSHIPVILLTALHSKEHELEGLSLGADDYITKPFDISVLQAKIENILSIRESLKEKYTNEIILQPRNLVITSPDEKFLQKAIEAVEKNIADSSLDIERFATEVGVSRMQLYRKLHALTDMTVKEFIRGIRLKRAAQLLLQKKLTISEIAFDVGFKDLSHFRKCFKQEFGVSASEYVNQNAETHSK